MRERTSVLLPPARATAAPAVAANPVHSAGAAPRLGNSALHAALRAHAVQAKLHVGGSDDAYEREADRVANRITGGGVAASHSSAPAGVALRITALPGAGGGPMPRAVEDAIGTLGAGGSPLPPHIQSEFGPRLGADLSDVRVHTGDHAAGMAASIGARAFTVDRHIVFGAGEYQPASAAGRHVIAHELAHSVQQRGGSAGLSAAPRTAQRFSLFSSIASTLSELAIEVPGYELMTLILGRDPITDEPVVRTAEKVVHAVLMLFPFAGESVYQNMKETGQLKRLADYINQQVDKLHLTWSGVMRMFSQAVASLGASDFFQPSNAWAKIKAAFGPTLGLIMTVVSVISKTVTDWIKKKAFDSVRGLAMKIPGYKMLSFVLGRDPLTEEPLERTVVTFVRAAFDLLPGGDEMYAEAQKSGSLQRIHTWLNKEVDKLDLTWAGVKAVIRAIVDAFEITDFFDPAALFKRLDPKTMSPLLRLIRFIGNCADKVWELIVDGFMRMFGPLADRIMGILRKIGSTFMKIVSHPIDFCGHLVDAMKGGFHKFSANIEQHLKNALVGWLTGALGGVTAPKTWEPADILAFVLDTIGISYAKFREKIVKRIGEPSAAALEQAVEFVILIKERGLAAGWDLIVEKLGDVKSMVLDEIKDWAITKVTVLAVEKIVTMFIPGLGIYKAVKGIYNTIAFFVERWNQIVELAKSVTDSLSDIVDGKIPAAINAVERTMVKSLPVIMGFLARFLEIDNIAPAIQGVVKKLTISVDNALEKVIDWVIRASKTVVGAVAGRDQKKAVAEETATPTADPPDVTKTFSMEGVKHELSAHAHNGTLQFFMASISAPLALKLAELQAHFEDQHSGADERVVAKFRARIKAVRETAEKLARHEHRTHVAFERNSLAELAPAIMAIAAEFHITGEYAPVPVHKFDNVWGSFDRPKSITAQLSGASRQRGRGGLYTPSGHGLRGMGYHRGHLLAESLGGSGMYAGNIASMTSTANQGAFTIERSVRDILDAHPTANIHYTVEAKYPDIPGGLQTWLRNSYGADIASDAVNRLFKKVETTRYGRYTLSRRDINIGLSEPKPTEPSESKPKEPEEPKPWVKDDDDAKTVCQKIADYYWAESFTVNAKVTSGISPAPVIRGTGTIGNRE
jgi:hypothetical protein